jgi:hydrogenase/urease accessory protein HupE
VPGANARRGLSLAALGLALTLTPARAVFAHDQPYSYLDLRFSGARCEGTVMAHVVDLATAAGLDADSLFFTGYRAAHQEALARAIVRRLRVRCDGESLALAVSGPGERMEDRPLVRWTISGAAASAPAEIRVSGPVFEMEPQHQTYVNLYEEGKLANEALLDAREPSVTHFTGTRRGVWAVVRTFAAQGIHHIFIGPDHILFVLALLLLGGSFPRLLKIVTAFTLAHSVTLALAALEVVRISPRLIEPAIAASIVLVGLENLRVRDGGRDARVPLAFGFGLVHGFGFASVLAEFGLPRAALGWSLAAFNLGVEIGQATIVAVALPILGWLAARHAHARAWIVRIGSPIVIAAGAYWLVQRLIG